MTAGTGGRALGLGNMGGSLRVGGGIWGGSALFLEGGVGAEFGVRGSDTSDWGGIWGGVFGVDELGGGDLGGLWGGGAPWGGS